MTLIIKIKVAAILLMLSMSANGQTVKSIKSEAHVAPEDYVLFVTIKVKSGKAQEYKNVLKPYLEKVRKESGIRTYKAHESAEDPSVFEIYAHFDSKSTHEAHLNQAHTKEYLAIAKPLFDEGYPVRKKAFELR